MSVQNTPRRSGPYVGTGLVKSYPFSFKVFGAEDVKVVRSASADNNAQDETLKLNTDYSVALNSDQDTKAGGTVNLTEPLADGIRLSILSAITPDQQMVLTNHDGFLPETLNEAQDKAIALIQELKEEIGRTLKTPASSNKTPEQLTEELLSAQDDARKFADQAKTSAEEAKASELKTAEYAEAATVLVPMKAEIKTVADNITDVVSTGKAIEDVKTVSSIKSEVVAVGTAIEQVKTVANPLNLDAVKTVSAIKDQVVRDAEISAEIVKVANASDHVVNVSTNMQDVKDVSNGMPSIQTVAGDLSGGKCTPSKFSAGRITDEPAQDCTVEGGNIKTVADHIVQVDKVAAAADNGTLDKAANSVETTAQNVARAEAAQVASEAAQRAAESAQGSAETAAANSVSSAALSKKWATQTTAPVEGGLYGAKYYADKASVAQGESSQTLDSVKKAGTDAVSAINAAGGTQLSAVTAEGQKQVAAVTTEGGTQVKAVQAAGAVQTANAKAQADAAARSATAAGQAKTDAETAKGGALDAQKAAETAKTGAESAKTAAVTAQGKAETAAGTATTKANAAAASAEEAKKYANQAATGQVQADWAEKNAESKGFIRNKPDVYLKSETYAKTEVYTKGEVDTKLETSSAGADSVELCQQLIGFHNGYTGESLDYRDYLDHKPQEYLDNFYAFGTAFEGAINAN